MRELFEERTVTSKLSTQHKIIPPDNLNEGKKIEFAKIDNSHEFRNSGERRDF